MGKIRILEDKIVNQIAAGEVVERPAAVLKELIENSLDANARCIEVSLERGGRNLLAVADDGHGMDAADALMCLERHGTSKIRDANDLYKIASLGFRGEAVPSIAAVSRFNIVTRQHDSDVGTKVVVEGGVIKAREPVGCPIGTKISAGNLFYNVPVRRKFLRTVNTELSHCLEMVISQALIRPDVDWTVAHDGRVVLRAPVAKSRKERAATLLKGHGRALVPVSFESGELSVEALISPVGVHQGGAKGSLYLYVNGRYVRDPLIRKAVREAYRHIVPKGRFPVVVMEITLPPDEVDVNIHPTKVEVRFQNGRDMVRAVSEGLREGLQQHGIRRPVERTKASASTFHAEVNLQNELGLSPKLSAIEYPSVQRDEPGPIIRESMADEVHAKVAPIESPSQLDKVEAEELNEVTPATETQQIVSSPNSLLPVPRFQDLMVVGQLLGTYVVCEGGGELILIDQHAAHERVTLHKLMQNPNTHLGGTQQLLTPEIIDISLGKAALLEENLHLLSEYGLELEPYGSGSFAVRGVPTALGKVNVEQLVHDVVGGLSRGRGGDAVRDLAESILATMSCHGSVRAHQKLNTYEMQLLLKGLDDVDFSVCAHGRPVAIRISEAELEKRFHRS